MWDIVKLTGAPTEAIGRCLIRRESGTVKISEPLSPKNCRNLTSCAEGSPASLSQMLENAEDLLIQGGRCSLNYPAWLKPESLGVCCLKMFPDCFTMTKGGTFAEILHALDRLGYFVEWQVLNSKDFHVLQSRKRVYLVGYLDERCRGKIFPFTETAGTPLKQVLAGSQGGRVYSAEGVSCTLTAQTGGMGGKTGLYALPCCVDLNESPEFTQYARCLIAKQDGGIHHHKREASGVWDGCRIRRLTPRECLRLQGWKDERIDLILPLHSDTQLYKQAGNGVTVNVVEAIGKRLTALHREVTAID